MPLYELFCMARPALARPDAAQLIRNIAGAVLNKDGVLTDIKSFGDRQLAYTIKRPGQRYEEVIPLPAGRFGAGRVDLSLISDGGQIVTPGVEVPTLHPWRPSNVCALLQAFMWQIDFAASPSVLDDLKHLLKVRAAAIVCRADTERSSLQCVVLCNGLATAGIAICLSDAVRSPPAGRQSHHQICVPQA